MSRPTQIRAGAFTEWTESDTGYSADDGYEVKAQIVLQSGAPVAITVESEGAAHTFTLLSAQSSDIDEGTYRLMIWAEKASETYPIADEYIEVLPNLYAANATAQKSFWRRRVEILQAKLLQLDAMLTSQTAAHNRQWTYKRIADVRAELQISMNMMFTEEGSPTQTNQGMIKVVW